MEVNEATTFELGGSPATDVTTTWSAERAEARVAAKVAELRRAVVRRTWIDVTPAEAFATVERAVAASSGTRRPARTASRLRADASIGGGARSSARERTRVGEDAARRPWRRLASGHERAARRVDRAGRRRIRCGGSGSRRMTRADRRSRRYRDGGRDTVQAGPAARGAARIAVERARVSEPMSASATPIRLPISQWRAARAGSGGCARVPKDLAGAARAHRRGRSGNAAFAETLRGHLNAGRGIARAPRPSELVTPAALAATSRMA